MGEHDVVSVWKHLLQKPVWKQGGNAIYCTTIITVSDSTFWLTLTGRSSIPAEGHTALLTLDWIGVLTWTTVMLQWSNLRQVILSSSFKLKCWLIDLVETQCYSTDLHQNTHQCNTLENISFGCKVSFEPKQYTCTISDVVPQEQFGKHCLAGTLAFWLRLFLFRVIFMQFLPNTMSVAICTFL